MSQEGNRLDFEETKTMGDEYVRLWLYVGYMETGNTNFRLADAFEAWHRYSEDMLSGMR